MNEVVKIVLGIVISGLIVFLVALLKFLFEYFGCETEKDKIEVLNLMYAYNIIYNFNFSCQYCFLFFAICLLSFFMKYSKIY